MARPAPISSSGRRGTTSAVTKSPVPHLSDSQGEDPGTALTNLAGRAAAGDRAAMEALLLEAQAVAWRFSRTVCGHTEDAEDVMQEALVQTYRFVSRLRDVRSFRPWLYRTVRNACLMSRRKRVDEPRQVLSLDALLPGSDGHPPQEASAGDRNPEELVDNAALRRRLKRALGTLPPPFRAVVFLREMEGLSTRETAHALGVSEDTVKARLHRARLVLQHELAGTEARQRGARGALGRHHGREAGGKR